MKGDQMYLRHILDAMARIESYISVGRDVFMATTHWQDALIRQLEIIGGSDQETIPGTALPAS
jgi:uncharacterized protein with HEPN domain